MNDRYILSANGKAVVLDENGEDRTIDNGSNLAAILEQENVIEVIEDELIHIKEELRHTPSKKWKRFIPKMLIAGIAWWTAVVAAAYGVGSYVEPDKIWASLDTVKTIYFTTLPYIAGFFGVCDVFRFFFEKSALKNLNGYKLQLACLEDKLVKEKEKLEALKKSNVKVTCKSNESCTRSKTDSDAQVSLDGAVIPVDTKNISSLGDTLGLCYSVGRDYKSYLLALKQDILVRKIREQYSIAYGDADIGSVEEAFVKTFKRP